jgi:predicted Zn-ribbon and HTH transcriptional regulator
MTIMTSKRLKPICEVCGGYGYNFNTEHGNAIQCPSCKGDKISRDPRHKEAIRGNIIVPYHEITFDK